MLARQRIEMSGKDCKWRPQLVSGIGQKVTLRLETVIETVERAIDREHRRLQLRWQIIYGEAQTRLLRTDAGGKTPEMLERPKR